MSTVRQRTFGAVNTHTVVLNDTTASQNGSVHRIVEVVDTEGEDGPDVN